MPLFSNWYLEVNPDPSKEVLNDRWSGIETLCETLKLDDFVELAKLAFNAEVGPNFKSRFNTAFQDADSAFRTVGNEVENAVLAGAALAYCFENSFPNSTEGALAVCCINSAGLRSNEITPWLVSLAESFLRELELPTKS